MPTACTICGSVPVLAHAPGDAGERAAGLVLIRAGAPARAWCAGCWERAFGPKQREDVE